MQVFWVGIGLRVATRHRSGRLKQWLNYMRRVYPQAQQAFDALRLVHDASEIDRWLQQQTQMAALDREPVQSMG
jgi:tRNA-dihydrouridine synthase C